MRANRAIEIRISLTRSSDHRREIENVSTLPIFLLWLLRTVRPCDDDNDENE